MTRQFCLGHLAELCFRPCRNSARFSHKPQSGNGKDFLIYFRAGINFGRNAPRSIFGKIEGIHFEIAHSSQVLCVPGVVMVTTINLAVIA
jgi:hypothetical protein